MKLDKKHMDNVNIWSILNAHLMEIALSCSNNRDISDDLDVKFVKIINSGSRDQLVLINFTNIYFKNFGRIRPEVGGQITVMKKLEGREAVAHVSQYYCTSARSI